MKIFFDANIFYTDLLFKHPEIQLLLEMSSENFIEIYIFNMVICELIHNKIGSWKDYIIWNSYEQIINNLKEEDYIFISNNTNDFASQSNKEVLNPNFLIESKNIKYYHSIKDLFEKNDKFKVIREKFEKLQPIKELKDLIEKVVK